MAIVLNRTTFGLHTVATGSNIVGAREIGVRTDRIKVYNFMIVGGLAALAGVINTVQFASADPLAGGPLLTLQAIAAAVIGGTSLLGGSGTPVGSLWARSWWRPSTMVSSCWARRRRCPTSTSAPRSCWR